MNGYFVIKTIPEAIAYLPKKEQQEAAWAVMLYGSTGELPQDLSPAVQAVLTFICPAIDNANKQAIANRENGKNGGRPRKNEEKEQNPMKSESEPIENPMETQSKPIENPNGEWVTNGLQMGLSLPPAPPISKQDTSIKYQDTSNEYQDTSNEKENKKNINYYRKELTPRPREEVFFGDGIDAHCTFDIFICRDFGDDNASIMRRFLALAGEAGIRYSLSMLKEKLHRLEAEYGNDRSAKIERIKRDCAEKNFEPSK